VAFCPRPGETIRQSDASFQRRVAGGVLSRAGWEEGSGYRRGHQSAIWSEFGRESSGSGGTDEADGVPADAGAAGGIPKEGKAGASRPLGIGVLEDKVVQKMTQKVLESIYEPLFLDCSFGFRPGRGCHDAIQALYAHLDRYEVETVIDIDLANFFGTIDHRRLLDLLAEKIGDRRFLRYIARMFKAGVLADGELTVSEEGVPQGGFAARSW